MRRGFVYRSDVVALIEQARAACRFIWPAVTAELALANCEDAIKRLPTVEPRQGIRAIRTEESFNGERAFMVEYSDGFTFCITMPELSEEAAACRSFFRDKTEIEIGRCKNE